MATILSRRALNRSTEECYASPTITTLVAEPLSLPSSPLFRGRLKRTEGSSSDSDESESGMRNEDFRAGGPHLCVLPALNNTVSPQHPAAQKWDRSFEGEVIKILNNHGVKWETLSLLDRRSARFEDDHPTQTVVISATKSQRDGSWVHACVDIRSFFVFHDLPNLNVEIIDKRASATKYTFPTSMNDKIYPHWNRISKTLCEIIGLDGWLSLECFRRGTQEDPERNPPTVLLTVPFDSSRDWKSVRDKIVDFLDSENLSDVAVEILRSYIWRGVDVDLTSVVLPDNSWKIRAQLGMSIGPHGSEYSASTLGGFLELLNPVTNKWSPFGVTCYHCIEPGHVDNQTVARWRLKGISINEAKNANIQLDQPALKDHVARMRIIEQNKTHWRNSSHYQNVNKAINNDEFVVPHDKKIFDRSESILAQSLCLKDRAEEFFSSGRSLLGRVFAASGYRLSPGDERRHLDWSLIQVTQIRLGKNHVSN